MTEAQLQAIEARAREAIEGLEREGGGSSEAAYPTCEEDVPALVAEVRRLEDANDLLSVRVKGYEDALATWCGRAVPENLRPEHVADLLAGIQAHTAQVKAGAERQRAVLAAVAEWDENADRGLAPELSARVREVLAGAKQP